MKFGLTMFSIDYSIAPGERAAAIEEGALESLWVPEHSHFPVSLMTPGRDRPGLPPMDFDVIRAKEGHSWLRFPAHPRRV